jgi:hypothetical protein
MIVTSSGADRAWSKEHRRPRGCPPGVRPSLPDPVPERRPRRLRRRRVHPVAQRVRRGAQPRAPAHAGAGPPRPGGRRRLRRLLRRRPGDHPRPSQARYVRTTEPATASGTTLSSGRRLIN